MPEAIYNDKNILVITQETIDSLKQKALMSPRKRYRLCMHNNNNHPTQEMMIVFNRDSFMPPHRHPHWKSESYHIVEGSMRIFFFNDEGNIIGTTKLNCNKNNQCGFLYRLSAGIWHMPVPRSEWLVYHETYTGPFDKKADVEFPSWAPQENDKDKINRFLNRCFNTDFSNHDLDI